MEFFNYDNPSESLLMWRIGMARAMGFGALIFIVAQITGFWQEFELTFYVSVIVATVYHYVRLFIDKRKERKHRISNEEG